MPARLKERRVLLRTKILPYTFFGALVLFALAIRLHHLDFESLFMDELRQVSYYSASFSKIITLAASQQQPPLDYWIGHLVQTLSTSDFASRLPAALFGTGSILILVLLSRNFCSWPVALGTGLLASLLPFNIYFSQEARPYTIAIFFMLAVLWSLNRLLKPDSRTLPNLALLLFFTLCFLLSRTLSPLVVTVLLLLYMAVPTTGQVIGNKWQPSLEAKKRLLAGATLLIGLLGYLPSLLTILKKSGSYIDAGSPGISMEVLWTTVTQFDIMPLWRAYTVQTEPLGPALLILLFPVVFLTPTIPRLRENRLWRLLVFLLPTACLLNLFIFQAKAGSGFRPPYAIYLLPLVLLLTAGVFQTLWELSCRTTKSTRFLQLLLMISAVFLVASTVYSAILFKNSRIKTDWRGLTTFLESHLDNRHLLIFDSLSVFNSWEPTFYGFKRYYQGQSQTIPLQLIPANAPGLAPLSLEPVIILFQWREYFLTPFSRYHFMHSSNPRITPEHYRSISRDPELETRDFVGFSLIRLKNKNGRLREDLLAILNRLLIHLPPDSSLVELHLAAASLAMAGNLPGVENHLDKALFYSPPPYQSKLARVISKVKQEYKSNRNR